MCECKSGLRAYLAVNHRAATITRHAPHSQTQSTVTRSTTLCATLSALPHVPARAPATQDTGTLLPGDAERQRPPASAPSSAPPPSSSLASHAAGDGNAAAMRRRTCHYQAGASAKSFSLSEN